MEENEYRITTTPLQYFKNFFKKLMFVPSSSQRKNHLQERFWNSISEIQFETFLHGAYQPPKSLRLKNFSQ